MKKILEYLRLIPKGLKNINKVVEGIDNEKSFEAGELSMEESLEVVRRRSICATCPFMSTNAVELGTYTTTRDDEHCTLCACNIKYKTACMTCECGIEEYNKTNPPIPLKWEAFKKK